MAKEKIIAKLVEALQANMQVCLYYDGIKVCGKIARHMFDDYDSCTEYFCDKHKDKKHFNTSYSGIFKPSELAEQALESVV